MAAWLRPHAHGWLLAIHVQPGAKDTAVAGVYGDRLKLRLQAPPVDGKANAALVAWIAERLRLPKGDVLVLRGNSARDKDILVRAPEKTSDEIFQALQ